MDLQHGDNVIFIAKVNKQTGSPSQGNCCFNPLWTDTEDFSSSFAQRYFRLAAFCIYYSNVVYAKTTQPENILVYVGGEGFSSRILSPNSRMAVNSGLKSTHHKVAKLKKHYSRP